MSTLDDNARQTCSLAFSCKASFPPDAGVTFEAVFGTTEAECFTKNSLTAAERAALNASVAAARIKFNAADANTCVAGLATQTCPQLWGTDNTFVTPPECATAIVGTVALGGACTFTSEPDPADDSDVGDCAGPNSCDQTTMVCVAG